MKTYKILNKQNIYDVAVMLYGSVEGIFDLLVHNENLSFETELAPGMTLEYDETNIIYPNIVESYKGENYVAANGDREVYYKSTDLPLCAYIHVIDPDNKVEFAWSGNGDVVIDWGDNTSLETIPLPSQLTHVSHYFNDEVERRVMRIYGNFQIDEWNITQLRGKIYPVKPFVVDKFTSFENYTADNKLFLRKETQK